MTLHHLPNGAMHTQIAVFYAIFHAYRVRFDMKYLRGPHEKGQIRRARGFAPTFAEVGNFIILAEVWDKTNPFDATV